MTSFSFIWVSIFNFPSRPRVDCLIFLSSPLRFHLPINVIFSSHHRCKKYSNLWCSNKWKMDLQVKKLEEEISATPGKTLSPVPIITLKAETNYSFPQLREKKNALFVMRSF